MAKARGARTFRAETNGHNQRKEEHETDESQSVNEGMRTRARDKTADPRDSVEWIPEGMQAVLHAWETEREKKYATKAKNRGEESQAKMTEKSDQKSDRREEPQPWWDRP